jgi:hypothetical protein
LRQPDHTPQLLSQLMLSSISKVNLICADLQLAIDEIKIDDKDGVGVTIEKIAKRTQQHASEITDVVSVLQDNLQKVLAVHH